MEVDAEKVLALAESADKRGKEHHAKFRTFHDEMTEHQRCMRVEEAQGARIRAQDALNDAFYWFGHKNAYLGVVAMAELATIVEDELDAEGSCP